jgi:hypothetical protein
MHILFYFILFFFRVDKKGFKYIGKYV